MQRERCAGHHTSSVAHLHVLLKFVAPLKVVNISLDWHVVEAKQVVEDNAKVLLQLLLVDTL